MLDDYGPNPIAIIGMACRFPGADTPERFWQNLCAGRESIRRLSEPELCAAGVAPELLCRPDFVPVAAALDGLEDFDHAAFGMSAEEAALLDPQQRVLLECALEALESAGCDPERFEGSIGVYTGSAMSSYLFNLLSRPELLERSGEIAVRHANDKDYVAAQISYRLDLRGPSLCVQSGCATGSAAIHVAAQALAAGDCNLALVGAASVRLPQLTGYVYRPGALLSRDGHCRVFDARASGMVFGNGAGVLALRPLRDALADRDPIRAVIVGSALNNAGALRPGALAPGLDAQRRAAEEALALAGVTADSIGYVEAHGSATPIGDAVELKALSEAFGATSARRCAIGSVKSNVGHLGTAASIAGLIKAVLCVERAAIPASLGFESPHPELALEASPFRVCTALEPWPESSAPRRACVNAYGMTGSSAHLVLQEAPAAARRTPRDAPQLLTLAARSDVALQAARTRFATYLEQHASTPLLDVALTLSAGRRRMPRRSAIVASDARDAAEQLRALDPRSRGDARRAPRIAVVFPDAVGELARFERELREGPPLFVRALESAAARAPEAARGLQLQLALHAIWQRLGLQASAASGYGEGEIAAAYAAGMLDEGAAAQLASGRAPARVALRPGALPVFSSALGRALGTDDGERWPQALARAPRRALPACDLALVLGTHETELATEQVASLHPARHAQRALLEAIGLVWCAGAELDMHALYEDEPWRRAQLPTYAFDRSRAWIEAAANSPLAALGRLFSSRAG